MLYVQYFNLRKRSSVLIDTHLIGIPSAKIGFTTKKRRNPLGCTAFRRSNSSFNCFTSSFHMLTYDSAGSTKQSEHTFSSDSFIFIASLLRLMTTSLHYCWHILILIQFVEKARLGCTVMNTRGSCCLAFLRGKTFSVNPNFTWISISTCWDRVHYAMVSLHICKSILVDCKSTKLAAARSCFLHINSSCRARSFSNSFTERCAHGWPLFQPSNVHRWSL